jgi:hypothetical protein
MADSTIAYDRAEVRRITSAFKAMDAESIDQARQESSQAKLLNKLLMG